MEALYFPSWSAGAIAAPFEFSHPIRGRRLVKCKEERLNAVGAVAQPLKSGSALPQADSGLFGGALAYCRGYPAPREVTRAGPVKLEIEV